MTNPVAAWLKTEFSSLWNWMTAETAAAASLLSPIIDELAAAAEKDAKLDISAAVTAVAAALASGTTGGALLALAVDTVKTAAVQQGIQLSEEAATALGAALSKGAQISAPLPDAIASPEPSATSVDVAASAAPVDATVVS